jgi:hypothetical protein
MSFLTPLFLLGLAGLAIPVIIHLIQRERKNVVQFPSLMFLRRIPYQSVQRRRIRHWPLLLLRLAALILVVAAFARPFLRRESLAAAAAGGAREVVFLVDRSYSMAYGDRWARAVSAASQAINAMGPGDRGSLVFFGSGAEVALRSTSDRGRLVSALASGKPGATATRFGPAVKLAGSMLSESALPRREVVLVSDFQRGGWLGTEGTRLPDGAVLTPVVISDGETSNASVTPVSMQRSTFNDQERVTLTGGLVNHGSKALSNVEVTLEIDGHATETQRINVEANSSASVTFAPFTPPAPNTRGVVRIGADALPIDNAFHFTVSPRAAVRIVLAERPNAPPQASLYLTHALSLGDSPPFSVADKSIDAITVDDLQRASIVVLNDVPVAQLTADRLKAFVTRGGGVLVVLGERTAWPAGGADFLPGVPGPPADRTKGQAARLGALEYGHPIFEPFRAPRTGDFSSARFYTYRTVTPAADASILARFDDGAPALLERRIGTGRVLMWTSTMDLAWNDLPIKAVFLPFVHRVATTLASYAERPAWLTVGEVFEPAKRAPVPGSTRPQIARVVLTPSGQRIALDGSGPGVVELSEQGFYEVRAQGRDAEPPVVAASNVDLTESDLTPVDPQEVVAGVIGRAGGTATATAAAAATDQEHESTQRLWWYLLFFGVLVLLAETVLSNRLGKQPV